MGSGAEGLSVWDVKRGIGNKVNREGKVYLADLQKEYGQYGVPNSAIDRAVEELKKDGTIREEKRGVYSLKGQEEKKETKEHWWQKLHF